MKNKKPAYLLLYETLRQEIVNGDRKTGDRLPSRRQLCRDRGVSAVTVDHSYDLLCQEGYIQSRARSGYYVSYRIGEGFARPAESEAPLPRPHAPQLPQYAFPLSVLARTMRRVITDSGEALLEKAPNAGSEVLRQALSRYLARNRGIHVSAAQIVIGAGAEYLYGMVVEMLDRRRVYGIEQPSYEKIEQVYRSKGVVCDLLPLGNDGIQTQALRATEASVLHITPYRSFPSGVTASASKRREYLRWAAQQDRIIVEDDFESEFSLLSKPEETVFSLSDRQNVIYLNTFSRTISPSLRAGYMVLPPRLLPLYNERVGFYSCAVPVFEQYVLAALLNDGDFERHINRIRREKRRQTE